MLEIFDTILEQAEKQWKETDLAKAHELRMMENLKNLNAFTPDVEMSISNYGMQLYDDGITIGFITALQIIQELTDFSQKYKKTGKEE